MNGMIQGWNGLDWVLAGIVVVSAVRAMMRGLVRTVFALAGLLCGFAIAEWKGPELAAWVVSRGWIAEEPLARVVCFVMLALGVMVVFALLGGLAKRTAHAVGLGMFDRALGGLLGVARGVLVGVAVIFCVRAVASGSTLFRGSCLSSYFLAAGDAVSFLVPHSLR